MAFSEKLYRLRKERGYTQEQLARELDVSRQAISRWELGEAVPGTANVLALCRLFSVTADELLSEDTRPKPEINQDAVDTASGTEPEEPDASGILDPEEEKRQLRRDILRVNTGILVRIAFLTACVGLHNWLQTGDPVWRFVLAVWGIIAVAGIAWWNHGWYIRDRGSYALLRWDLLLTAIGAFLPRILADIPGNWGIFLGLVPGAFVIGLPIRQLLADHYRVEPPGRRKS